jgi:hypothetical protein
MFENRKSLSDQVIIYLSQQVVSKDIFEMQGYKDAETSYIQRLNNRIQLKKQLHFMRLCKLYYSYARFGKLLIDTTETVYSKMISENCHWKVAQWAACEISFGFHRNHKENAVERIRMELPFEHEHGRSLKFSMVAFEESLSTYCPDLKGTVHDWYKVFLCVPKKILLYEEFFG